MPTGPPLLPWNDRPGWPGRDDLLGGWVQSLPLKEREGCCLL